MPAHIHIVLPESASDEVVLYGYLDARWATNDLWVRVKGGLPLTAAEQTLFRRGVEVAVRANAMPSGVVDAFYALLQRRHGWREY